MKIDIKRIFAVVFMWWAVCGGGALCQTKVWETSGVNGDTTIVRHCGGEGYIVYSRTGSWGGTFSCHDNTSGVIAKFEVPINMRFYDFRIAHDTIFAGGSINTGSENIGLLACIDIVSMLAGAGHLDYFEFPRIPLDISNCYVSYFDQVVGVKRLALFEDGDTTRMAYIADNHILETYDGDVLYRRVGYGDVALLLNGVWDICSYHYNKDGWEEFTDICCTDNKIVLTARNKEYESDLLRFQVFDKVRNFAHSPAGDTSRYFGFDEHTVVSSVAVTATVGDQVAMAYHYKDGTEHGLAVKVVDVASYWPVLIHSEDVSDPKLLVGAEQLNEMVYQRGADMLMILSRMSYMDMGWRSCVTSVGLTGIATGAFNIRHCPVVDFLHSIDGYTMGGFISSGMGNGTMLNIFNDRQDLSSTCTEVRGIKAHATLPRRFDILRHHCTIEMWTYPYYPPVTFVSSIEKEIFLKCQY